MWLLENFKFTHVVHIVFLLDNTALERCSICRSVYWASLVAQMVMNLPARWEIWVLFLGWEDPLKESFATHSSILTWRIHMGKGAWQATVHGVAKSQTRLSD